MRISPPALIGAHSNRANRLSKNVRPPVLMRSSTSNLPSQRQQIPPPVSVPVLLISKLPSVISGVLNFSEFIVSTTKRRGGFEKSSPTGGEIVITHNLVVVGEHPVSSITSDKSRAARDKKLQ